MGWKALGVVLLIGHVFSPAHAESPISGEFAYVGDYLHNSSGGIRTGSAYLQNVDVSFELDLESLFGLQNGSLFAYFLWNDDTTFSDRYSGDGQVVSSIDTDEALRLFEFWYEHRFSDAVNLRVGLYDLNSEFDAIDTAGLFVNSSHGVGAEYAQTGENGPSIFPSTSLAARLQWELSDRSLLRYALLDGVPGDPDDPSATAIQFNSGDGLLHAVEFNHVLAGGTRLGAGGFLYTGEFETLDQTGVSGSPRVDDGNSGVYVFADVPIARNDHGREITGFVRYGIADDTINALDSYFGVGIALAAPFAGRPDDHLGLAVASAGSGDDFKRLNNAEGHETIIELTYSAQLTEWLRVQPDIQYVINPSADPTLDDALVLGVRFEVATGFGFD